MYPKLVRDALAEHVAPVLEAMGFARPGRSRQVWTGGSLQVRAVVDSKARDPYRGGAFTLEFGVSDHGRFEEKLSGRVRLDQLLDDAQRERFLRVRNAIARRFERPPADYLAAIDASLHDEYFKPFQKATELEAGWRFWMRSRTREDVDEWCRVMVPELPTLVERARRLPAHDLLLGKSLDWS
jgi:hypothetical protein